MAEAPGRPAADGGTTSVRVGGAPQGLPESPYQGKYDTSFVYTFLTLT